MPISLPAMKQFILTVLLFGTLCSQGQDLQPKREFRAAWVATVGNIDWPSKQGLDAETQKAEFRALLQRCLQNHLNALIVQIRPAADALYNSPYENWSRYLSGKQGQPPTPYYDPLEFIIEECHAHCVEFHAWFNPYRALVDANKNLHTRDHITWQHPEWFVNYGGKRYFNPGLPEVRDYFIRVVLDVVKRYDIDAVHFDDYFYPYRIAGQEFGDAAAFARYGNGMSKDNWRRNNVDVLIEELSRKIKAEKAWVKFGISPFGVWRNDKKDPEGSHTTAGQTNYDDLYADVLLWMKKKWIDYILPQLYWENGHRAADYAELLRWWSEHRYGRHLYIGHGLYQVGNSAKACWNSMNEIELQVEEARKNKNVQGSAYYSSNAFKKNLCGLNYSMQYGINIYRALLPVMNWLDTLAPDAPVMNPAQKSAGHTVLTWKAPAASKEALQYAVYRFPAGVSPTRLRAEYLLQVVRGNRYEDEQEGHWTYAVTALDRLHNESALSNEVHN